MIGEIRYSLFDEQLPVYCRSVWKTDSSVFIENQEDFQNYLNLLFTNHNPGGKHKYAWAEQVHGNQVLLAADSGKYARCDGLLTTCSQLGLIIRTADCAAVMCYHPEKKSLPICMWDGVGRLNTLFKTPCIFCRKMGNSPSGIISGHLTFYSGVLAMRLEKNFLIIFLLNFLKKRDNKIYFDLHLCIREQLLASGILADHLEISSICTHCSSLQIPSYRRDKTQNRLINMIEIMGEKK